MNEITPSNKFIDGFRNAAPYIHKHHGQCFVIALSGASIAHANFSNIVHDIAVLHSLGIRIVLIYGVRFQVEQELKTRQLHNSYHHGLRITDKTTLNIIEQIAGQLRIYIEAAFSKSIAHTPLNDSNIHLSSGNLVSAAPMGIIDGVDMQHTGKVRKIDHATILSNLSQQRIVLLSTLAYSSTTETFNLSLIELAKTTAAAIKADKLIVFNPFEGLLDQQQRLVRQINSKDPHSVKVQQSQLSLYNALVKCVNDDIARAHILSYKDNGALLTELFTHIGAGTLISRENYERVRTATDDDVRAIISLIEPLEEKGILVKRSRSLLQQEIQHFTVIEHDQRVIGCAALYPFSNGSAEIACIVTHPDYQNKGLASRLLEIMQNKARSLGCSSVFVLSTQTTHWFKQHGFVDQPIAELPVEKKQLYNFSRNSKMLNKALPCE